MSDVLLFQHNTRRRKEARQRHQTRDYEPRFRASGLDHVPKHGTSMTAIVYDGVGGGGGTLFDGMKFFIAQRVPLRLTWIQQIEENGGQIVKLDKQADMVIVDHMLKDAPTGSISWKYIEESVKKGRLEDIEDYRAGPATTVIQRPGTGQPMKTNSRHTMQSWRDRWIKQLSHRPRPDLPSSHGSASPELGPQPKTNEHRQPPPQPKSKAKLQSSPSQPRPKPLDYETDTSLLLSSPVASQSEPRVPYIAKSKAGNKFSKEDEQLLLHHYDEIMNIDENKYPHHTGQEWRNFFMKEIMPKQAPKLPKTPKKEPVDMNIASDKVTPKPIHEVISPQDEYVDLDTALTNEGVFKEDLVALARGLDLEVDFYPRICDRSLPLFKLWQTVMSDEFGGSARVGELNLWPQVAKKLDFTHPSRHLDAPKSLKACYAEILVDFEQTREEFERLGAGGADTQEGIVAQLRQSDIGGFEEDFDDDLDSPQSSPVESISHKRSLNSGRPTAPFPSDSKRRRLDKGKARELEIPPTPDDKLNNFRKPQPFYPSLPLKLSLHNGQEEESHREFAKSSPQPSISQSKQEVFEPETQDFYFSSPDNEDDDTGAFYSLSSPSKLTPINKNDIAAEENLYDDSSTESQTGTQRAAPVNSVIENYVALGYPEEIVVEALEATTMETGDVGIVMECLLRGEAIPEHIQGVWTAEDDEALEDPESIAYELVLGKHGETRVAVRKQFLVFSREVRSEMAEEQSVHDGS
ncbi:hypothetical protein B7494_g6205 [Chlorociboria aeruginascens]|nr:hypothetical protein B7494_g6205 [Chlorociboria aeruginascens]